MSDIQITAKSIKLPDIRVQIFNTQEMFEDKQDLSSEDTYEQELSFEIKGMKNLHEVRWENRYRAAVEFDYYSSNGSYPSRTDNKTLHNWCRTQLSSFRNGKMSEEKIQKLSVLSWWKDSTSRRTGIDKANNRWITSYKKIRKLDKEGHTLNYIVSRHHSTASWCKRQYIEYNSGQLNNYKRNKLEKLSWWGEDPEEHSSQTMLWESRYLAVLEYDKVYRKKIPSTDKKLSKLYNWCRGQVRRVRNGGCLSKSQLEKLEKLSWWRTPDYIIS